MLLRPLLCGAIGTRSGRTAEGRAKRNVAHPATVAGTNAVNLDASVDVDTFAGTETALSIGIATINVIGTKNGRHVAGIAQKVVTMTHAW